MNRHHATALICLVSGAGLLLAAAWLPFQTPAWTAWRMAGGYGLAGGQLTGPLVGAFHLIPFFMGLVLVLAALLVERWPRLAAELVTWFGAGWLFLLVRFEIQVLALPALRHPWLWAGLAVAAVGALLPLAVMGLRARGTGRGVGLLSLVLVLAAGAQLAGQAAFALIEDDADLALGAALALAGVLGLATGVELMLSAKIPSGRSSS